MKALQRRLITILFVGLMVTVAAAQEATPTSEIEAEDEAPTGVLLAAITLVEDVFAQDIDAIESNQCNAEDVEITDVFSPSFFETDTSEYEFDLESIEYEVLYEVDFDAVVLVAGRMEITTRNGTFGFPVPETLIYFTTALEEDGEMLLNEDEEPTWLFCGETPDEIGEAVVEAMLANEDKTVDIEATEESGEAE